MAKKKAATKKVAKKQSVSKKTASKPRQKRVSKKAKIQQADAGITVALAGVKTAFIARAALSDIKEGDTIETVNGSFCNVVKVNKAGDCMLRVIRGGHKDPRMAGSDNDTQYAVNVDGGLQMIDRGRENALQKTIGQMLIVRKVDMQFT